MTAPLPPLPRVPVTVPADGFENAVRAAGRRRWRTAGRTAGGALTALVLAIAVPGTGGGTAGLAPAGVPPRPHPTRPVPQHTAAPGGVPGAVPGGVPGRPDVAADPAAPDVASPVSGDATEQPHGRTTGRPSPPPAVDVPWRRYERTADPAALATCGDGVPEGGTRSGDWCVTTTAQRLGPGKYELAVAACAVAPGAPDLTFHDGREVDFELLTGSSGPRVWSSATGRTFPAAATAVEASYGECTHWTMLWNGVGDSGEPVAHGSYSVRAVLRLLDGSPSDSAKLALS